MQAVDPRARSSAAAFGTCADLGAQFGDAAFAGCNPLKVHAAGTFLCFGRFAFGFGKLEFKGHNGGGGWRALIEAAVVFDDLRVAWVGVFNPGNTRKYTVNGLVDGAGALRWATRRTP